VLSQMFFGAEVETMIHFLFGAGFALISFSVFDFKDTEVDNLDRLCSCGRLGCHFPFARVE